MTALQLLVLYAFCFPSRDLIEMVAHERNYRPSLPENGKSCQLKVRGAED